METVTQKYLRNEYASIEAYNAVAGEVAEPYRVLVVADFPYQDRREGRRPTGGHRRRRRALRRVDSRCSRHHKGHAVGFRPERPSPSLRHLTWKRRDPGLGRPGPRPRFR